MNIGGFIILIAVFIVLYLLIAEREQKDNIKNSIISNTELTENQKLCMLVSIMEDNQRKTINRLTLLFFTILLFICVFVYLQYPTYQIDKSKIESIKTISDFTVN